MTPGKGSKYREFYDLSGRITCMQLTPFVKSSIMDYQVTMCNEYAEGNNNFGVFN